MSSAGQPPRPCIGIITPACLVGQFFFARRATGVVGGPRNSLWAGESAPPPAEPKRPRLSAYSDLQIRTRASVTAYSRILVRAAPRLRTYICKGSRCGVLASPVADGSSTYLVVRPCFSLAI
ncbi:hypothetical protein A0H81_05505 [Grifola frondosa]|uniref:Uncharacterized protein n=1 Tax=Grifola frondosa TaxID=5627 RepID=A0A1C7MCP2_GRIFR|nr:hypothetical protein A0H81_05505 [Grifola frondosa]